MIIEPRSYRCLETLMTVTRDTFLDISRRRERVGLSTHCFRFLIPNSQFQEPSFGSCKNGSAPTLESCRVEYESSRNRLSAV